MTMRSVFTSHTNPSLQKQFLRKLVKFNLGFIQGKGSLWNNINLTKSVQQFQCTPKIQNFIKICLNALYK